MAGTNGHMEAQAWLRDMANATAFLTRLPIPAAWQDAGRGIARSARAFPLAGALIGAATSLALNALLALGLAPLTAAALAIAATALLTGGLHEDGLADLADGFGGGRGRERKLEIMRDSRIGSYGVLALVLAVLVKASALAAAGWPAIILAAILSRTAMVWLLWSTPQARADGLSVHAGRPSGAEMVQSLALAALLAALLGVFMHSALGVIAAILLAGLAAVSIRAIALSHIGGQTGDVCGALQTVSETLALAMLSSSLWAPVNLS